MVNDTLSAVLDQSSLFWVSVIIAIFSMCFILFEKKQNSTLPLPPIAPGGIYEFHRARAAQTNLMHHNYILEKSLLMPPTGFGTVFRCNHLSLLCKDYIIVTDYELARLILLGDNSVGIKEGIKGVALKAFNFIDRNIPNLFTAVNEDIARERARKFIAPAFSSVNLQHTEEHLNRCIDNVFTVLEQLGPGGVIDMKQVVLKVIMDALTRSSFDIGSDTGSSQGMCDVINGDEFLDELDIAVRERALQHVFPIRKYMFWDSSLARCEQACAHLAKVSRFVMEAYKRQHPDTDCNATPCQDAVPRKHDKIIDRIMRHNYGEPTDLRRMSDIITFILAGHETSSFTLCFLLMDLAMHADAKRRLQQELDEAITPSTCPSGRPSSAQVGKLNYLWCCMRESMRLWPVAGSGRLLQEDIRYRGMLLPKGYEVEMYFYAIFRQPWIDRPNDFLPERWEEAGPDGLPSEQLENLKSMFMPFSLGRRNCIGQNMALMQMKALAANFFRYYDFVLVEPVKFENFLTVKPDRLMMRVTKR